MSGPTRLVTPGSNRAPIPSSEEVLITQMQILSQFLERYGNLLIKADGDDSEKQAKEAFSRSAAYMKKVIDLAESFLEECR